MFKLIKISAIFLLLINIFSFAILSVQAGAPPRSLAQSGTAADTVPGDAGFVPAPTGNTSSGCPKGSNCGNYTLNDMIRIALIISQFILGVVGSLALLAFIAGGLIWILSAGNDEWVKRGKDSIIGATVGLVIVFTSFMIIQLVFSALGIEGASGQPYKIGSWAISSWFK